MRRAVKILSIVFILVLLMTSFMACSFEYGTPDKLDMANSSVGERILIGLQVAALGIAVVFVVLALLIGFIILFKYLFKWMDQLKAKTAKKTTKVAAPKEEIKPQIVGLEGEDEEIAAVISAAIMAYYEQNKQVYTSNLKFRVRNINEIK